MLLPRSVTTVTHFSKALAMFLFVTLPFFGFYLGMQYQKALTPQLITTNESIVKNISPSPVTTSPTPIGDWKVYTNKTFTIFFWYPSDWFGPDIYEYKDGLRLEIGTDKVYPYGTGIENRVYTKKNSYYITFQYTKKSNDSTIEQYKINNPWLNTPLSLSDLKDNESQITQRSKITKVQDLHFGRYQGVEYISTLSDTAQTEPLYTREVFLIDDNYNIIRISGTPENVDLSAGDWRKQYMEIDEANKEIFRKVVESSVLNTSEKQSINN